MFKQVSLTSGVPLAGCGEMDSLIPLEHSQMCPAPTKPRQLVPEKPQILKKHNSPKPCLSKFPIPFPHKKVIKTSQLSEAHISTHSPGYFPPVKSRKKKKGNNYTKNNIV